MRPRQVDFLQVADLRHHPTVGTLAAEAAIARSAGYTSALRPVHSTLMATRAHATDEVAATVRSGAAGVVLPAAGAVHARLLLVRHPVLLTVPDGLAGITAERVVVLARPAVVATDSAAPQAAGPGYSVDRLDDDLLRRFGDAVEWVMPFPGGELPQRVGAPGAAPRWPDVVDTTTAVDPRPAPVHLLPVIGRHGRTLAWPGRDEIGLAYPLGGDVSVHVMGDVEGVRQALGSVPATWTRSAYDLVGLAGFLAQVDVAVHLGPPEGLGPDAVRPVLESVAAGVPTLVDPSLRPVLGDLVDYVTPAEAVARVRELHADPVAYQARALRGREILEADFGPSAYLGRLRSRVGEPAGPSVGGAPSRPTPPRPRVLMVSSNGAGMGHLTRLLAYARRLEGRADVAFLSMSQAVPVVGQWHLPYDYLPSTGATGMPSRAWHRLYYERAVALLDHYRPDVVVFDGTYPYAATARIRAARPDPRWVWSRRGMWRADVPGAQLQRTSWFDAVLEPGDLAAPYDRGATAAAPSHRIGPVTLLDREESQSREEARAALGLPAGGRLALISLGAGNINDIADDTGAVTAALRRLGVGICLTQTPIGLGGGPPPDVHVVQDYPLARRYRAFDVVVSAAGYNSFHELLRVGVPTLFVPNAATSLDDQVARARYAADQGWAHQIGTVTTEGVEPLLADLLARGPAMVAGALRADPGNGAEEAARFLVRLAAGVATPISSSHGEGRAS